MSFAMLRNLHVEIMVTDPWEFGSDCGTGPFAGTTIDTIANGLVIQLDRPIQYRGQEFRTVLARPRHERDPLDAIATRRVAANLLLIPRDLPPGAEVKPSATEDGMAAVGTVAPSSRDVDRTN
jgi:hypothetical protein